MTEARPILTQALDALETRLKRIRVINGYHTDAGQIVVRGRRQFNAMINPDTGRTYDPFPLLSIADISVSPAERAGQSTLHTLAYRAELSFTVIGAGLIGQEIAQSRADELFADITKAITLDPLVDEGRGIVPGDAIFDEVEIGSHIVTVQQSYTTELITHYGHVPVTTGA